MNPAVFETVYIGEAVTEPASHMHEAHTERIEQQVALLCDADGAQASVRITLLTGDGVDPQGHAFLMAPFDPIPHTLHGGGEPGRIRVGVPPPEEGPRPVVDVEGVEQADLTMPCTHRELLSPCRTPTSVASYFDRIVASSCSAHHIHILLSRQQHRNVGLHSQHAREGRSCQGRD
ncbi:hypothetical protein B5G37_14375 [Pseudoflavonifractor sp. An85]|nr:hypothetical protein B5G37_14375 [Pseudoflavonifractor sp. An85]